MRSSLGNLNIQELPLGRLARDQVAAAIQQSVDGAGETFCQVVYARSGGHPFFLTELLHAFAREGIVKREGATWKARHLPEKEQPLPDNVRNFIELRLRARGDNAANLACALALDPAATTSDLADALVMDEGQLMDAVDDLLALGLIEEPETGPEFAFTHHLIGEVAATLLNSARRTSIHAAFARRLARASERDTSLRRARHLDAAHNWAGAAEAYLQAATQALEYFAWRDALALCEDGLKSLERLKDDDTIEATKGRLNLLKAKSYQAGGDDEAAIDPVGDAVEQARNAGDNVLLMEALQARAAMLLNCHHITESLVSAQQAAEMAAVSNDFSTLAQSNITLSAVYMHLAQDGPGVEAARTALQAAQMSERSDVVTAAADQLLRVQVMWWHFGDAAETAALGTHAAQRAGWVLEGAFHFTRGAMWYYLERFDDAQADFWKARDIAEDRQGERRWLISLAGIDRLKLRFFTQYMLGVVAAARGQWDEAAHIAQALAEAAISRSSYMVRNNVLNLWIDALLGRGGPEDAECAFELASSLHPDEYEQGSILDLSTCLDLARARVAARLRKPDSADLLTRAFETIERYAQLRPLEGDRAFAQLASACRDAALEPLESRATERCAYYRARRIAAAGALWGGTVPGSVAKHTAVDHSLTRTP
jgi:hypothetical protein